MTKSKRCGACGSRNLEVKNIRGRHFNYRSYPRLKLDSDVFVRVCNECDNEVFSAGEIELLDEGLKTTAMMNSRSYVEKILEKMSWLQSEMAEYIGCSAVYLSELKNGKRVPEFKTYNYFKLLSECPGAIEMIISDDPRIEKPAVSYHFTANTFGPMPVHVVGTILGDEYPLAA